MPENRKPIIILGLIVALMLAAGLSCRLTSPTPASWSRTSTPQSIESTNTPISQTQQTESDTPTDLPHDVVDTPTPQKTDAPDGPWLVYLAPDQKGLHAYDVESGIILEISLPEPILIEDLTRGLAPDGHTLIVRAGSPLVTDELALYQIDLPSTEIIHLTPLLSLSLQRDVVNEEDGRAFETLQAVTRSDGIAWSPDGRFLAFTAALDSSSSDLYVFDTERGRIDRLNGLYSQSAAPFWAPESNWLIFQELSYDEESGWRSEVVSEISVPGYVYHNTLYIPHLSSQEEAFLGWINLQSLMSYSQTAGGNFMLRQVNVETLSENFLLPDTFEQIAFDTDSKSLAYVLSEGEGMMGGVYLRQAERATADLLRGGVWDDLIWEDGGMFIATSPQGVFAFTPLGESVILSNESHLQLSPNGSWMVAWGEGDSAEPGAWLYQSPSGNLLQELTDKWVDRVYWAPDSRKFFILAEGILYHLAFPGLDLQEIEGDFQADTPVEFAWVESSVEP
jgi:hypothetical protein